MDFSPQYLTTSSGNCKELEDIYNTFQAHVCIASKPVSTDVIKRPFPILITRAGSLIDVYPIRENMPNLGFYSEEQYTTKDSEDRKIQAIKVNMGKEKLELRINRSTKKELIFNIHHNPKGSKE